MGRTREEIWGEILRTAWLVRAAHNRNFDRVGASLTSGQETVPIADLEALADEASDAIILVGLIEEHELAYPTEAGAQLPPQPPR